MAEPQGGRITLGVEGDLTLSISGQITLERLRRFVERTAEAPGDTRVSLREHKSHSPVDFDSDRISVTYKVE